MNVHNLVALMHVAIGQDAHHSSRKTEIELQSVVAGILQDDEGKERTFPILDALARICVSDAEKQVVAIGLQLQLADRKICLTVAENEDVKNGLVPYLGQAWEILRQLSQEFKQDRLHRYTPKAYSTLHRKVSPTMPQGVGQDIKVRLFRHIYLYTKAKNDYRFSKSWDALEKFMHRFYQCKGIHLLGNDHNLDTAFRALKGAYKDLGQKAVSEQDDKFWKSLFALFEVGTYYVQKLTGSKLLICDVIVAEVGMSLYYKFKTLSPISNLSI